MNGFNLFVLVLCLMCSSYSAINLNFDPVAIARVKKREIDSGMKDYINKHPKPKNTTSTTTLKAPSQNSTAKTVVKTPLKAKVNSTTSVKTMAN